MKKNIIVVTGGAGFVGSNLIKKLLEYQNYKIISIDNYSSGFKKNHIRNKRIKYINEDTKNINFKLNKIKNRIDSIFHFGEFARIYQSFDNFKKCFQANSIGTIAVFNFCLDNNIKLIYSATSASLGRRGKDQNLSPYSFTKAKNLEFLENLKKWFKFKYEIIYFYNVYGPKQISQGKMATVIGIFENQVRKNQHLTVVRPGYQTRRFTHIEDTISTCIEAWRKNKNRHYSISSKQSFSILQVAKMFSNKIRFLPSRPGERYVSAVTRMNLSNKIYKRYGKITLKNYINDFLKHYKK